MQAQIPAATGADVDAVTRSDESGTVEVVVSGLQVDSVRISNLWKDRFDTGALAATVSELIREALPSREAPQPREPHQDKHLPLDSVSSFIAELRAGRQATRRYVERLKAGEVDRNPETRLTDPENRVEVSLRRGRFNAVLINPEWAEKATIQTLCDTLLTALTKAPLVSEPAPDPDLAEAQKHYDAARRHLSNK